MSTFKVAGVSRLNGEFKVRFANDMTRVKVLAKNGHKDIDLMELKEPMTKEAAIDFLLSIDFDNGNAEVRATLEAEKAKREPKPAKEPRAAKSKDAPKKEAKKPKKDRTPSLEKIAARKPASTKTREEIAAKVAAEVPVAADPTAALEEAPF